MTSSPSLIAYSKFLAARERRQKQAEATPRPLHQTTDGEQRGRLLHMAGSTPVADECGTTTIVDTPRPRGSASR